MQLDGHLRFDNFVVGSANRLAAAAARAVADAPGATYNPLFIYSGSGLGKTHLAGAIGWQVRQRSPQLVVEYATLDEFVEQLHVAVSTGQGEALRQRYARVDLLLLDDVQFLTGRRETQAELLRLFETMQAAGRQVVMTSDRPPQEIPDVDERLVSRLAGGLIVDIGPPDYETKLAILRAKTAERGPRFSADVLEELARLDFPSVREMQGALNRLAALAQLGGEDVLAANVQRLLGQRPAGRATPSRMAANDGEFLSFVADVAAAVATHVDDWRARLGEAAAMWSDRGYRAAVLERAMELPEEPDVDGLLETFAAAVEHLRVLEDEVAAVDPSLRGLAVFRDPEGVAAAEAFADRVRAAGGPLPHPSVEYPRDRFAVSASNQLAVRAADAVVSEPGRRFNPLFLHGPSGVGKTHLMNAIGLGLAAAGGRLVALVSAPAFVDELVAALQAGTVEQWRARYRAADALLLDDVHFVAGKERTQEELFHIFNMLAMQGKQLVFTSDRPPRELDGLADRLRTRFEGGLVAAVHPPDRALREELYRRAFAHAGVAVPDDVLAYLADRAVASAREVQGTANRVIATAEAAGGRS